MTIVVRVSGGLGNQLFQYAMGRYLALRHGTKLLLEDSFYFDVPRGATPRTFELGHYPIAAERTTAAERRSFKTYTGRLWRILRRYLPLPGRYHYVWEPPEGKLFSVRDEADNSFLDGYWQSPSYVQGIEDILKKEFVPLTPLPKEGEAVVRKMQAGMSVSLHVRRGDYVTNPGASAHHGVCSVEYYQSAMRHIAQSALSPPVFFVFSEDLDWVRENLDIPFENVFVTQSAAGSDVHELYMMSCCKHHIIANSSFSWWGAWLSSAPEKIVVRPKQWLAAFPERGDAICPAEWVAL